MQKQPIRQTHSRKIIAVVGPTASGKSALGVYLAQKLGGEIISADSRQVYKGLNIGTGKVTKREMQGVPHHLLDVASPKKIFTAHYFVKHAQKILEKSMIYHTIPIVVGGTGFYVDALLGRTTLANVPPNPKLRKRLKNKSAAELFVMLKKLDPARAKTIDPKNPHRLIRAIEVAKERPSDILSASDRFAHAPQPSTSSSLQVLWLGLDPSTDTLRKNIRTRLHARMKRGMLAEAKKLHHPPAGGGISYKRMEELGLEYRFLARHLQKKIPYEQMLLELERAIWQYAKRQRTWFKRNRDIHWVQNQTEALRLAKKFISR